MILGQHRISHVNHAVFFLSSHVITSTPFQRTFRTWYIKCSFLQTIKITLRKGLKKGSKQKNEEKETKLKLSQMNANL